MRNLTFSKDCFCQIILKQFLQIKVLLEVGNKFTDAITVQDLQHLESLLYTAVIGWWYYGMSLNKYISVWDRGKSDAEYCLVKWIKIILLYKNYNTLKIELLSSNFMQ